MKNVIADRKKELARKHGREVDEVRYYPGGLSTSIFMDKESFEFTSVVGNEVFTDVDGAKVRRWAHAQLKTACEVKWVPVIIVLDVGSDEYNYCGRTLELHNLSIDVCRIWVCELPGGGKQTATWDVPEEKRLESHGTPHAWARAVNGEELSLDKLPAHDKNVHVLPYSEEMWSGLNQIVEGIDKFTVKLHALLRSKDGQQKVINLGSRMLGLLEWKEPDSGGN